MKQEKTSTFPLEIKRGSVRVKIYRTVDRGRDRFTVSYHEGARRNLRQFADFAEAKNEAGMIAERLNAGQGSVLELTGKDRDAYQHAIRKLKPLGISMPSAIDEYAEAKAVGVPLLASVQFYKAKHHAKLTPKTVSEVVKEFIAMKKQDGMSLRYLSDCRSRLGRLADDMKTNIAELETSALVHRPINS